MVPDEVFAWIGKYNQHWWKRRTVTYKGVVKVSTTNVDLYLTNRAIGTNTIQYSDSVQVVSGKVVLVNPNTVAIAYANSGASTANSILKGKYVTGIAINASSPTKTTEVYYVDPGMNAIYYTNMNYVGTRGGKGCYLCSAETNTIYGEWEFITSSDRNTYPDSGITGGYEYQYLGVPFDKLRTVPTGIETGSYTGSGTYGESSPNTLTFSFRPQLVIIVENDFGQTFSGYFIRGAEVGMTNFIGGPSSNFGVFLDWNNDSVSWFSNNGIEYQLNRSGITYCYLAIG